jgi:hypothetical protein
VALGVVFAVALSLQCHQATVRPAPSQAAEPAPVVKMTPAADVIPTGDEALARREPLAFLEQCLRRYREEVRDYRAVFSKQERIDGDLRALQRANVRVRAEPLSVDMEFFENVREAKRALYVAGAWFDDDGVPQVWAKPGGAILRAVVPRIQQPVAGKRAKAASRRSIDQFGFGRTLELILEYSYKAQRAGQLRLQFAGQGLIDGRPTYVFKRWLPYDGDESNYPDNLLVFHIDQDWHLPTAVYAYSDDAGEQLLGSYVFSEVELNPGYTADDFDPDKIDF